MQLKNSDKKNLYIKLKVMLDCLPEKAEKINTYSDHQHFISSTELRHQGNPSETSTLSLRKGLEKKTHDGKHHQKEQTEMNYRALGVRSIKLGD